MTHWAVVMDVLRMAISQSPDQSTFT